jgi:hypothetical protein
MRHQTALRHLHAANDRIQPEGTVGATGVVELPTTPEIEAPRLGWRECSISGCPCQAFVQSYGSELCSNCGHKYTDHW